VQVNLLDHQWESLQSTTKYTCLLSGVGGGKTWCGVHWCINKCQTHPHSLGFIGASTYAQLRNSTLAAIFNELSRLSIPFSYNQSSGILSFMGKKWLCRSLDNYDVLRGIEIGEFWIDEAAYIKQEAYEVLVGRLRDKKGSLTGFITTTPKGFNWVYDFFHEQGKLKTPQHRLITTTSYSNKYLPDGYLDSLKEQYDAKMLQQEVMGEFVNIAQGQVYYAFSKELIKEFKPFNAPYWIGQDFNVDPCAAVVCQVVNNCIYVIDERFIRNSDTYQMAKSLQPYRGANVVPDSTGKARSTKGISDHQIMQEHGFNVIYNPNPFVIDRVNNMNRILANKQIIIHPSCSNLINDLQKVSWKEGKTELDQTTNKLLTHVSDALGYIACYVMPMRIKKKSYTTTRY
jgi:PBSX family phage terminase large subunit